MTEPPRRRNPLARTPEPAALPAARSRAALGLAAAAAEGRFALQVCDECGTVQYPPRDVCVQCLSDRLPWRAVAPGGTLAARTAARVSSEQYFRDRAPWNTGLVHLDCGPKIVAHLHGALAMGDRVVLTLHLDRAGRGAMFAMPEVTVPNQADDPALLAFTADPRHRQILIADARTATGPALARAFVQAGAAQVLLGVAEPWRPLALPELGDSVQTVPLDLTDAASVDELANRLGDKVDILVNNAAYVRPGGILGRDGLRNRSTFETNCLGAMRLASAFGPVMQSRTDERGRSAAAYVTIISAWALAGPAGFGAYAASQAALRSLSHAMRAEMRPSGLRVVDVLTGPIDDEWHRALKPPKVSPATLATAVIAGLRDGREEVVVGDIAREIHTKWAEDPRLLRQETV